MTKINLNKKVKIPMVFEPTKVGGGFIAVATKRDLLREALPLLKEIGLDNFFEWNEANADPKKVDVENYLDYLEQLLDYLHHEE